MRRVRKKRMTRLLGTRVDMELPLVQQDLDREQDSLEADLMAHKWFGVHEAPVRATRYPAIDDTNRRLPLPSRLRPQRTVTGLVHVLVGVFSLSAWRFTRVVLAPITNVTRPNRNWTGMTTGHGMRARYPWEQHSGVPVCGKQSCCAVF